MLLKLLDTRHSTGAPYPASSFHQKHRKVDNTLYFKRTNFREQKFSRFSRILASFVKINVFENSEQGDSRKFMLAKNTLNS